MTSTLLLIGCIVFAVVVVFGPSLIFRKKKETQPTESKKVEDNTFLMKLHGGPADGCIEKIVEPERPLFFVAAYPPKADESGMPPEENVVGHMHGKMYVRPNYAYYRYVLDDEYVYVRDLEEREVHNIELTGEQPEVQPRKVDGDKEE